MKNEWGWGLALCHKEYTLHSATIYTLHNSTPVRLHFLHFSKYKNSLQMTRKLKTFHFYLSFENRQQQDRQGRCLSRSPRSNHVLTRWLHTATYRPENTSTCHPQCNTITYILEYSHCFYRVSGQQSSSSSSRIMNHNWSAKKQRLHPQSVADISRHSALSGDRIWQCETSSGSRHKDTDQCL